MTDTLKVKKQDEALDFAAFESDFMNTDMSDMSVIDSLNQLDSLAMAREDSIASATEKERQKNLNDVLGHGKEKKEGIDDVAKEEGVERLYNVALPFVAYEGIKFAINRKDDIGGWGEKSLGAFKKASALRAAVFGREYAREKLRSFEFEWGGKKRKPTETGVDVGGWGGAGLGIGVVYGGARLLGGINDAIEVGRRTQMFKGVVEHGYDISYEKNIEKMTKEKIQEKASRLKKPDASIQLNKKEKEVVEKLAKKNAKKAQQGIQKEIVKDLGKGMSERGRQKWDDVAKTLLKNPEARGKVMKWLGKNGYKSTANLLKTSAAATFFPEWASSAVGLVGFGIIAYDIYSLATMSDELWDILTEGSVETSKSIVETEDETSDTTNAIVNSIAGE